MGKAFEALKNFFETRPFCSEALRQLKNGVEIGVELEDGSHGALHYDEDKAVLDKRVALNPDVIFKVNNKAADVINQSPVEDIGDFSVLVMTQIKEGNVKLRVVGSFLSIATNGYMSIIKLGGKKMWEFLASHGLSNIFKLTGFIKDLVKQKT